MKLVVENMVCDRCVESVDAVFSSEGIALQEIGLGHVETEDSLAPSRLKQIAEKLEEKGFALARDRKTALAEEVRVSLLNYLRHLEESKHPKKISEYLMERLHYNYSYLSKLFSEQTGETVERYLIRLKIERVKELLSYDRYTLSEIAWQLKYSSVQYLSNQFKKITGKTVTEFLEQKQLDRKQLDQI